MCGLVVYTGKKQSRIKDLEDGLESIRYRGPDDFELKVTDNGIFGFVRLSIMDLSYNGNQPFESEKSILVCNGEIYNYEEIKKENPYPYKSTSDCEVILPLYENSKDLGAISNKLDSEHAFVLFDKEDGKFKASRDPIGIRPLFYGYDSDGEMWFASEVKAIQHVCNEVKPFPPGHYFDGDNFVQYLAIEKVSEYSNDNEEEIYKNINKKLVDGVIKRLHSDAPIGFLLSGGLDSSIVCAIAQRHSDKPIKTFAVGINKNPIDTKYAKIVADYLGTDHTEVLFSEEDILNTLEDLIFKLETWDITTVRASMGMSLVCKYIKEKTDLKVLMTGEVSDEIFGYKYTDYAPSPEEFQKEAAKRLRELYLYDVLRADRCIASNSLEARVPFSDKYFVQYVMSIKPEKKMNHSGFGKYILRKAFEEGDYLPKDILYREKAAFSDAVGHRSVDYLKELADERYSDEDLVNASKKYPKNTPQTKEALMYRDIFTSKYPNHEHLIPSYWLPNSEWDNCDVIDPSARALPNYGKSGE